MGFMSYSLCYYEKALQALEGHAPEERNIYKAKQLLKMLDDLADEGYTALAEEIEQAYQGVSRLRAYLVENHAEPFAVPVRLQNEMAYQAEEQELVQAIRLLMRKARSTDKISNNPFLQDLDRFCEWIGYENDTAYIFLLRDTMLPYIRFLSEQKGALYPWLLGRSALQMLTGRSDTDDEFRASVMDALESGKCRNYEEFCNYVLPDIRKKISCYPEAEAFLKGLLGKITQNRIIIVESGCYGTFPMLLMSLDSRADMRMYTTVPYLTEVYRGRIFTEAYENNRLFETLYAQDQYFRLSCIRNGQFYVQSCTDSMAGETALAEVNTILR